MCSRHPILIRRGSRWVTLAHAMHPNTRIPLASTKQMRQAPLEHVLLPHEGKVPATAPAQKEAPSRAVHASVRPNGAMMAFYARTFEIVLTPDTPDRMIAEARRILACSGFEAINIQIASREYLHGAALAGPGNPV